jgi:hypothetical protein
MYALFRQYIEQKFDLARHNQQSLFASSCLQESFQKE